MRTNLSLEEPLETLNPPRWIFPFGGNSTLKLDEQGAEETSLAVNLLVVTAPHTLQTFPPALIAECVGASDKIYLGTCKTPGRSPVSACLSCSTRFTALALLRTLRERRSQREGLRTSVPVVQQCGAVN